MQSDSVGGHMPQFPMQVLKMVLAPGVHQKMQSVQSTTSFECRQFATTLLVSYLAAALSTDLPVDSGRLAMVVESKLDIGVTQ